MRRLLISTLMFAMMMPNANSGAATLNITLVTSTLDIRLDQNIEELRKGGGIATMDIPFIRATALQDIREVKTGEVLIAKGAQINLSKEKSLPQAIPVSSVKGNKPSSNRNIITLVGALANPPTIAGHIIRVVMDPVRLIGDTPMGTIIKLTISKVTPAVTSDDTIFIVNADESIY